MRVPAATARMPEPGVAESRASRLWQMALLIATVWLALAAIPTIPSAILPGLDPSWLLGVNLAHVQKLVPGKDIIWTYGPLSYLSLPVPGLAGMYPVLFYKLGVYLVWCVALIRLSLLATVRIRFWVIPLLGIVALIDPFICSDHLPIAIFTWSLLVLLDRSPIWRTAGLPLLAFLAGLACLVKANSGVAAICLFGVVLAVVIFQSLPLSRTMRWTVALALLLLPFSMVLLYTAETGSAASFPAFVRNSLEVASGYSEAMSINGPYAQLLLAVIGVGVLFLVLPWLERSPRILIGYLPALVYVFFAFKSGMVRQDSHAADFGLQLALAALFPLVFARRKLFLGAAICFQIAFLFFSYRQTMMIWPQTGAIARSRLSLIGYSPYFRQFLHWPSTWAALEQEGQRNLEPLRVGPEMQAAVGKRPIEALVWNVALVAANHWNWRPRPVFQSYAAYTPRLDLLNAAHLQYGPAADFAVVRWDDIDGRHPFLETPLSWRTQLDLYDTVMTEASLLLLGRRATTRFQAVQQLRSQTSSWERSVTVPESADPIMVSAHIHRSLAGKLRGLLFRSNPIWFIVTRKSGNSERYRALRANFADGVIINEFPSGLGDLALLGAGCTLYDPVVSFVIHTDSPVEFEPSIQLQFSRLVRRPEKPGNCVQAIAPSAETTYPAWGGSGTVAVSAGPGAQWTASTTGWIEPLPRSASGNANLNYGLLQNSAPQPRRGTIDIGGHVFRVIQRGLERNAFQFGLYTPDQFNNPVTPPSVKGLDMITDLFDGFAVPGDQLVIGDWTGNGMLRLGIFRDGKWYLDLNGNRHWDGENGGDGVFSFGLPGDIAAPGDWTGDGKTRLGVFRKGEWALDNGNMTFDHGDRFVRFGLEGDIPVVGKWSHGRMDCVGVYRNGTWLVDSNCDGMFQFTDEHFIFGLPGDRPIVSFARSNVGVYRNGNCILAPEGTRGFNAGSALTIPCGAKGQRLLIAAW